MQLADLAAYLDEYLEAARFRDSPGAMNGLQAEGRPEVRRVALAVDACLATIEGAAAAGADLLLVHHGLFWEPVAPLTGPRYRRVASLIRSGLAVYSCHLPLDAHPEVGNSAVLARLLGLSPEGRWGEVEGVPIGVWCPATLERRELVERIRNALGVDPLVIGTGPETCRRIGIVTGAGGAWIGRAAEAGCDTLVTGEGPHHTYFHAEELGINALYAGHYATETVGLRALGAHLAERFGLETLFLDHPTGL